MRARPRRIKFSGEGASSIAATVTVCSTQLSQQRAHLREDNRGAMVNSGLMTAGEGISASEVVRSRPGAERGNGIAGKEQKGDDGEGRKGAPALSFHTAQTGVHSRPHHAQVGRFWQREQTSPSGTVSAFLGVKRQ